MIFSRYFRVGRIFSFLVDFCIGYLSGIEGGISRFGFEREGFF